MKLCRSSLTAVAASLGCQASLELDQYTFEADGSARPAAVAGSVKTCPDDALLIDDMEDDPVTICPHHGRSANPWYTFTGSSDPSRTVMLTPSPIAYEAIDGTRMGSQRALHVVMATLDENDFAGFGVNFRYDRMTLPFDASGYAGLSLDARGSGRVLVRLPTLETQPPVAGGHCVETAQEPCYNDHHVVLDLTDGWQLYEYSFTDFRPATYGPSRNFDPMELVGLGVSAAFGESDVDIWLDDVRLLPADD